MKNEYIRIFDSDVVMSLPNSYAKLLSLSDRCKSANYQENDPSDVRNICKGRVAVAAHKCSDSGEKKNMADKAAAKANEQAKEGVDGVKSRRLNWHNMKENMKKENICSICLKILLIVLIIVLLIICIVAIALTVSNAILARSYSGQGSGKVAGFIVLTVTTAITATVVIYASVAICRQQKKPLYVAGIVLLIIALIQTVVCATTVKMTYNDEIELGRALVDSFRSARGNNARQLKLWSVTQYDLKCCGLYGPSDYRTDRNPGSLPDVPITCCPNYDPDRSELVQEDTREYCKIRREYRQNGCNLRVVELFQASGQMILVVMILLIIFEVITAIISLCLSKKVKRKEELSQSNDA